MPWKKNDYDDWEFEAKGKNKALQSAIDELLSWLPDEQLEYQEFVLNIVGALPGGDELADLGFDKYEQFLSWKEMDMVGKLLEAIQDKRDVEQAAEAFVGPPEDDDDDD